MNGSKGHVLQVLPSGRVAVLIDSAKVSVQKMNMRQLEKDGTEKLSASEEISGGEAAGQGQDDSTRGVAASARHTERDILAIIRQRIMAERDPRTRAKLVELEKRKKRNLRDKKRRERELLAFRRSENDFDQVKREWAGIEYNPAQLIISKESFGEGAERVVFNVKLRYRRWAAEKATTRKRRGRQARVIHEEFLCAKESRFEEDLANPFAWHSMFAETQLLSSELASDFNDAVEGFEGGCRIDFIQPRLIMVQDPDRSKCPKGRRCILVASPSRVL